MNRPQLTLVLVAALLSTPAHAEPALDQAAALYDQGRFEEAIKVLTRARAGAGNAALRARFDLQIGINLAVLGQEERARAAFIEALRGNPRADLDERVYKASVVTLFRTTRASLRGRVDVGGRDGLEVLIDGRRAGHTPLSVELAIGSHRIEVRSVEGRSLFRQAVVLLPDGRERVWVPEAVVVRASEPPPPASPRRVWTWVAAGTAAIGAGVCAGLYVWARSGYDEYLTTPDPLRYDELASNVPGRYQAAQAMLGVAVASAAAAVVLFFVEGRARAERPALSARRGGFSVSF